MLQLKSIFFLPLCLVFATTIWGQGGFSEQITRDPDRATTLKGLQESAEKALKSGDYGNALHRFKKVLEVDSLNTEALLGYGEAAVQISAFEVAASAYQLLTDNKKSQANKRAPRLLLADVQYRMGRYAAAKENYSKYLIEEKSISPDLMESIQNNISNCDWASGPKSKPNVLMQTPLMLLDTPQINSAYSEYSPYLKGETLYFSSYRFPYEKDRHFPKRRLIKVLTSDITADSIIATPTDFNESEIHTAHVTFNAQQDQIYYCNCKFDGSVQIICDLFKRKLNPDHKTWGPAQKLPDYVNMAGFTSTEPSIGRSADGKTEVLYFMSDRPGGKGKKDLWYSNIVGDSLSPAMNLLALNTDGDEVTPFYHNASGYLYYSTDGLQTMGGLDVYRSKGVVGSSWGEPEHLLGPDKWNTPINTGYNDVFYSLSESGNSIFLSSNRRGQENYSEDACCYDIFKADLFKHNMVAITFNKETGDSLYTTRMRLAAYAKDGTIASEQPFEVAGAFREFDLQIGTKYRIIAEKSRFSSDTVVFETPKKFWTSQIVVKLYLAPAKVNLIATVLEKGTKAKLLDGTSKFYDYGLVTAPNMSAKPLVTTQASSNQFDYKLEFDKSYKAVISKAGYTTDSTDLISTAGFFRDTTLRDTVYLTRGLTFKAHTLNALSRDTLYGVTYFLTDLSTGKILDKFVSPAGRNYQTMITYENRYRITATKEGYNRDSVDFTTLNLPKVAFQTILRELKLRPITIDSYLPIRLYFDNAIPSSVNFDKSPQREYRATYVDYIRRKEDFIRLYTEGLAGMELKNGTDSIDYFFEKEVRAGWDHLMAFSEVLYDMMSHGDTIEITLKGYASKLGSSAYNQALTDRRVSSVYNHFDLFDGGIYKKFVNKQLFFKREANGEADWPKNVSDNVKDKRKSVYDQNASRQRRLEIIGVKTNGKRQTIGAPAKVSPPNPR
jgi:tetratricopeptide (TPR) repeat protein